MCGNQHLQLFDVFAEWIHGHQMWVKIFFLYRVINRHTACHFAIWSDHMRHCVDGCCREFGLQDTWLVFLKSKPAAVIQCPLSTNPCHLNTIWSVQAIKRNRENGFDPVTVGNSKCGTNPMPASRDDGQHWTVTPYIMQKLSWCRMLDAHPKLDNLRSLHWVQSVARCKSSVKDDPQTKNNYFI